MKRANLDDINTRTYWNEIYKGDNRALYASQGTDSNSLKIAGMVANSMKTARFETALKYINNGDKVCDMGCGVGVFTELVASRNPACEIWGTDISDQAIEDNKKANSGVKYFHGYIGDQSFLPDEYFNVVFCGETIEHLEDPSVLFKEAYLKLKEGGKLIVTTPKDDHIRSDEHLWYFDQADVDKLFTDNGFKEVKFEYLPDTEHLYVIFGIATK